IPGLSKINDGAYFLEDKLVRAFNRYLFHIKDELVPTAGSGDTSYGWAQLFTYLLIALAGSIIWSLADRVHKQYDRWEYWLKILLRYYIALVSFSYGTVKIFALQMPFPGLSALATPLGDYLPMRFSWMFIGYSFSYQFFSGVMEMLTGIFLINRKTALLGALLGAGVYAHVFILNMSYDIPVKIFSFQMLICCLYLVWCDRTRVMNFFFFNRAVDKDHSYDLALSKKWQRYLRIGGKIIFILLFALLPLWGSWKEYHQEQEGRQYSTFIPAWYKVTQFVMNHDTLTAADSLRWQDIIFDNAFAGSIQGHYPSFRPRYGREYFTMQPDTIKKEIRFLAHFGDTTGLFTLSYLQPDLDHLILQGKMKSDTVYMELIRNTHHFQLADKQFHWLTEQIR
ncbi:MAG TPA: hypothetical protein VJ508_09410, partial [Saprospiraceae bacterium]|nr:hypothetical protein [Saprospiraceae bacterium]